MATFVSSVFPKHGFHPTFMSIISVANPMPRCSLYLYFNFPPLIFVDPYELALHDQFYTIKYWGTANLELPVCAVDQAGSSLLLNVSFIEDDVELHVKLPLHLRYGDPAQDSSSGTHSAELAWPNGFFVCPTQAPRQESSSTLLPIEVTSLFDLIKSTIIPIIPNGSHPFETVHVPIGNPVHLAFVETGTIIVIILCFFYVLRAALETARRLSRASRSKTD